MIEDNQLHCFDDLSSDQRPEKVVFMVDTSGSTVQHPDLRDDKMSVECAKLTSYARSWYDRRVKKEDVFPVAPLRNEQEDIP